MNRTVKELNVMLHDAIVMLEDIGIEIGQIDRIVHLNDRTKSFGICKRENGIFTIYISRYFKDNDYKEVMNTLLHELLHTVEGCFNHGNKWSSLANNVNKEYNYNISRTSDYVMNNITEDIKKQLYKYKIICKDCNQTILRQKKSNLVKYPENYRCGKCKGKFKVIKC